MNAAVITPESEALRALLPGIVRDLTATADPRRIVLFGSVARGEAHADSDIDLLVVLDHLDPSERARVMGRLRFAIDTPAAIDVYVTDEAEYERRKNVNGSLLYWPEREGEVVYERSVA